MARALEPGAEYTVYPEIDLKKDKDQRRAFVFKSLSVRDLAKAQGIASKVQDEKDPEAQVASLFSAIGTGLVRCTDKNGKAVPKEDADTLVNMEEAWDLYHAMLAGNSLSEEDAKKSESLSLSNGDESAAAASPASASA